MLIPYLSWSESGTGARFRSAISRLSDVFVTFSPSSSSIPAILISLRRLFSFLWSPEIQLHISFQAWSRYLIFTLVTFILAFFLRLCHNLFSRMELQNQVVNFLIVIGSVLSTICTLLLYRKYTTTSMMHERIISMVEVMRRVLMLSNDWSSFCLVVPVSIFRNACLDLIW